MQTKRQINGFTLIDLMVAMAVIGIGLAITIPAMQNFTNANRKAEQVNKLVRDITYAKSEAVNQGQTFCVSSSSATPVWDGGWTVTDAATNTIIRSSITVAIAGETLASIAGFTQVCFRADGSTAAAFTIEQCSDCFNTPNREKQVLVGVTGRVSLNSQFACPATLACP